MKPFGTAAFALAALAAACAPMVSARRQPGPLPTAVAWPSRFEGRRVTVLPPAPEDALLAGRFPGRTARFSDGRRQIVLRRLDAATRRLHPARDCFRATGHAIAPAPTRVSSDGRAASCFAAARGGRTLLVCEHVRDARGRSWPDISSWYWSALLGTSNGPWTAALTVERTGFDRASSGPRSGRTA